MVCILVGLVEQADNASDRHC